MKGKAPDCHMLLIMIREIQVPRDLFRHVFVVFLYVTKMFSESVGQSSPCFADVKLFAKSASYAVDDIGWGTGEMISDLDRWLGSRYVFNVADERTCFASCAMQTFISSGLVTCFNTLPTKTSYLCFCRVWMKLMELAKRFCQYRGHFEVIWVLWNDWFYCVVVRVKY